MISTLANRLRYDRAIVHQSIPSLTTPPPPPATPGDSHILLASGVGVSLLCLARASAPGGEGGLKSNKNLIILKNNAIFALSLTQMSSSSFYMFIYVRSEQCDLTGGPTYLLII